jgi:metallo-beta-lactamase class B
MLPSKIVTKTASPLILLFLLTFPGTIFAGAQSGNPPCTHCAEWNTPQPPFRIYGNTYYVGPHGLSSILITSNAGHILIDGALQESAQQIAANIRALGFRIEDVKLILNSHAHYDHAGGIAELQRLSGARVAASPWTAAVMKTGKASHDDPQYGVLFPITPIANVQKLQDGQALHVGPLAVTAHFTPGHTPGGTSWTWQSCEHNHCLNLVYVDSVNAVSADGFKFTQRSRYRGKFPDFEKSFAFLDSAPCDIALSAHPDISNLWDRLDARQRRAFSDPKLPDPIPDPMIDPAGCRNLATHFREVLQQRSAQETGRPPTTH